MPRYQCYCPSCKEDVIIFSPKKYSNKIECPYCGYPMRILKDETDYKLQKKIDELWEKNYLLKNENLHLKGEMSRLKLSNKVLKRDNERLNRKINLATYTFKPHPPCLFYGSCGRCPYFNYPFCEYREEEKDD